MNKKYWSKFSPGVVASVVSKPDYRGLSLAWVEGLPDSEGPVVATLNLEEWSDTEIAPVPDTVPDIMWLVISGSDADALSFSVESSEVEAAVAVSKYIDGVGYLPIPVVKVMTPKTTR